jgi:predicted GNAT superfamily acetyltransferase
VATMGTPGVVELVDLAALRAVAGLFREVWRTGLDEQQVHPDLMRALAHTGNYVAGAYAGGTLVGASVGFRTGDGALHSHVTAVAPAVRGTGVGRALKAHQRSWALARGITRICWTFDPLVRRNAHFNIAVLGARPTAYLVDFYGPMGDDLNGADPSDRLDVSWDLTGGPPGPAGGERLAVPLPADIEALRRADPAAATGWRFRLRDALVPALARGYRIVGIDTADGYLLERPCG